MDEATAAEHDVARRERGKDDACSGDNVDEDEGELDPHRDAGNGCTRPQHRADSHDDRVGDRQQHPARESPCERHGRTLLVASAAPAEDHPGDNPHEAERDDRDDEGQGDVGRLPPSETVGAARIVDSPASRVSWGRVALRPVGSPTMAVKSPMMRTMVWPRS